MTIALDVNGTRHDLDIPDEMPLLWAIREVIGLTGTKFGCGVGVCGACTVLVAGSAERACSLVAGDVAGRPVTTIEQVGKDGLHPVQEAWIAHNVPQCGFCQPGFIMAAIDLLTNSPQLTDDELRGSISNICRCGTYPSMARAIAEARATMAAKAPA